jgi:ABC transport system ATP-binding/permease protein
MIPYLQVEGLTRYWGENVLFESLNFTIGQGQKVALIARNGAGKTTLIDTITGKDLPDAGKVMFTNDITVGYLNQNPSFNIKNSVFEEVYNSTSNLILAIKEYEDSINHPENHNLQAATEKMDRLNAWDFEVKIKQILSRLKINNIDQPVASLSGGQQKRVALANVLINEPDFLILDEPTNHLDMDMIEWLEEYLQKSKCTLFMVTHDRYFLDRICNEILELDNKTLYRYKGNYSYFLEKKQVREEIEAAESDKARSLMKTELEWIRRMPKARGTKSKYRVESFDQLKEKASQKKQDQELTLSFESSRLGKKIVDIYDVGKSFGSLKIVEHFNYKFSRSEKIGIVGDNGSGKTTMLNLITGTLKPDYGKIEIGETVKFGYYTQDGINFSPDMRVIDAIQNIAEYIDLGKGNHWSASQLLTHFLFTHDMQYTRIEKLSGGERRRLYLCSILMQNPNFLILDEPTNDLDIMTLNVLEDYLQRFSGCVLIVSHDRYFMDKITDHIFSFQPDGKIKDYPGNYSQYREFADKEEKKEREKVITIKKENTQPKTNTNTQNRIKLNFNEKRELETLEKEIEKIENELNETEKKLSSGITDHNEITALSEKFNQLKNHLEEKEIRWMELCEKNENS